MIVVFFFSNKKENPKEFSESVSQLYECPLPPIRSGVSICWWRLCAAIFSCPTFRHPVERIVCFCLVYSIDSLMAHELRRSVVTLYRAHWFRCENWQLCEKSFWIPSSDLITMSENYIWSHARFEFYYWIIVGMVCRCQNLKKDCRYFFVRP